MIEIIAGKKGSGKTKKLLDQVNLAAQQSRGNIIFIDDDKDYLYDVSSKVRFIDASEYDIDSPKMFYGFLCGLAAQDYDLEAIYIDAFVRIVKHPMDELEWLFEHMMILADKAGLKLVLSVSEDAGKLPEYAKKYLQA
ncbi:MAG: twitching motility protein PilT [Christensenellales bacterium]|jgi:hypothetical protein